MEFVFGPRQAAKYEEVTTQKSGITIFKFPSIKHAPHDQANNGVLAIQADKVWHSFNVISTSHLHLAGYADKKHSLMRHVKAVPREEAEQ